MLTAMFALGSLYAALFFVSHSPSAPKLNLEFLANTCSKFSVVIVSIVRFTFLIKENYAAADRTIDYVNVFIWTSVEANISIICGQYKTAFSAHSHSRN